MPAPRVQEFLQLAVVSVDVLEEEYALRLRRYGRAVEHVDADRVEEVNPLRLRAALEQGTLRGNEVLDARTTMTVQGLSAPIQVDGRIELG